MATAAPFVKLLRQLSNARDEYRSGALDLNWDGGRSSLYLVFGQPNHATFASDDGQELEGSAALTALFNNLPRKFTIGPWRKEMTRDGTLKLSLDELMEPFAELAGASTPDQESNSHETVNEALQVGTEYDVEFAFGLEDFPLLPTGEAMFSDAAVNVVHLDLLLPKLPPSLIVLTGPKLRAAAVVVNGQLIDAVWVDDQAKAAGEGAAMAIMGAHDGRLSGYKLEDSRVAEAITMLWRCPSRYNDLSLEWLDAESFLERLEREKRDCALIVNGPEPGVALFMGGEMVATYTLGQREPTTSMDIIEQLLSGPGTLSILQRSGDKPIGRSISESDYHVAAAATLDTATISQPTVSFEDAAAELVPEHAADFSPGMEHAPVSEQNLPMPEWMVPHNEEETGSAATSDIETFEESGDQTEAPEFSAETGEAEADVPEADAQTEIYAFTPEEHDGNQTFDDFTDGTSPEPATAEETPTSEDAQGWSVVESTAAAAPTTFLADFAGLQTGESDAIGSSTSSSIDFDTIRNDLVQIGVLWLGENDVAAVTEMIRNTEPTVEAFVATIDAIKAMSVEGHDPSVVRAMAREMHYHAAEYLSGV
jgi:hypothetical protein